MKKIKKTITFLLLIVFLLLIGCKNGNTNSYIEESDTYSIKYKGTIVYIQNLSNKFDNKFNVKQSKKNVIEFETNDTSKGYELVTYSIVDFNEKYITQLKEQIQTAQVTYTSMEEYYIVDSLDVSDVLTYENDFGILNYQYISIPLKSSSNITYLYVAWQQIDNQLLLINSGGLASLDFFVLAPEYLLVSSTPLSNDAWVYIKDYNK